MSHYQQQIAAFINSKTENDERILVIGCKNGGLLNRLHAKHILGIDTNADLIQSAQKTYPQHTFIHGTLLDLHGHIGTFDTVVLTDVLDHISNILELLNQLHSHTHRQSKILVTTINPWYYPLLKFFSFFSLKRKEASHNFLEQRTIDHLFHISSFQCWQKGYLLFFLPIYIPIISHVINQVFTKIPFLNKLSLVQTFALSPQKDSPSRNFTCSVIIPCFNEQGHIEDAIKRIPSMGQNTEIIVVDDGSTDQTAQKVQAMLKQKDNLNLISYTSNKGKGFAVLKGFSKASGDVLMILDADCTVPPEELPKFFLPIDHDRCDFINGNRLLYPMENQAMRPFNLLGNKFFALLFSLLTGLNFSDTLCGTKAMLKKDFLRMSIGIDAWGDFDFLFGAAKLKLRVAEAPVHYRSRKFGQSKMKSFTHGLHLIQTCIKGFLQLRK